MWVESTIASSRQERAQQRELQHRVQHEPRPKLNENEQVEQEYEAQVEG
jgi:hypothetical protein